MSVTTEATATVFVTVDDGVYEQAETPFDLETASIVEITVDGTGGKLGPAVKVNDAAVTAADIIASNGVIHVIDKVLLP